MSHYDGSHVLNMRPSRSVCVELDDLAGSTIHYDTVRYCSFLSTLGGDCDGIQSYPLVDSSTSVAPVAATEAPTSTSVARNKAQDWIASRTDHSIFNMLYRSFHNIVFEI